MKVFRQAISVKLSLLVLSLSLLLPSNLYSEGDPRDSDSPFGVLAFLIWNHPWNGHHYDTTEKIEKAADLMQEAGVGFARIDFLWYDLEPEQGLFDFERYDEIVNILHERGIKILGILEYNPSWDNVPWNKAPDPELYIRYACAVVEHFKDRVKYWEIWNEPDEKTYWMPQDDMKTYTELLKKVYPAIKRTDPTCKVLMGSVSNTIVISLNRIYRNGGKDYFDIVNIHPFIDPLHPDAIGMVHGIYKGVRKIMQKYGDEKKRIWLTEIGCPGVERPTRDNGWWCGVSPIEEQQAEWVKEVYANCLEWEGVDKVFWAFFRDTDNHFKSGADYFGIIRCDFSKKPAYRAYKECATR